MKKKVCPTCGNGATPKLINNLLGKEPPKTPKDKKKEKVSQWAAKLIQKEKTADTTEQTDEKLSGES